MKNLFYGLITIFTFCTLSLNVNASIDVAPSSVCQILKEKGLAATKSWTKFPEEYYYGDFGSGCNSSYKELANSSDIASQNLAFYANGDKNSVKKISLTLNINNSKSDKKLAHQELLSSSSLLFQKVTNKNLSEKVKNSILKGTPILEKTESLIVEVKKENHGKGKYSIEFIIK
jgi:hypothetical protein